MTIQQILMAAMARHQDGDLANAERLYEQVLTARPDHGEALHLLGVVALQRHDYPRARSLIERAVTKDRKQPGWHNNLGEACRAAGDMAAASRHYTRAIALDPKLTSAHYNLGLMRLTERRLDDAQRHFEDALRLDPHRAESHVALGDLHRLRQEWDRASHCYREALRLAPHLANVRVHLTRALMRLGRFQQAYTEAAAAVKLAPDSADAVSIAGAAAWRTRRFSEALAYCRKALSLRPGSVPAMIDLGIALHSSLQFDEAMPHLQAAVAAAPERLANHSILISTLLLCPDRPQNEIDHALHAFVDSIAINIVARPAPLRDADPHRRLRVGYVSPDFREHSVAHFIEPLIASHDRAAVETFCYSTTGQPDRVTARFRAAADAWVESGMLSDVQLAEKIIEDRIDILVDLAGHTEGNRLPVFAMKPAPIQISFCGYADTTGLSSIDYRLTDAVADPPGQTDEARYREHLWRLPDCFLCYRPPEAPPDIRRRDTSDGLTFGCFNNAAKFSSACLAAWGEILATLPNARLLIKWKGGDDPEMRATLMARLVAAGIAADRVELRDWIGAKNDHLASYNDIDIALDTFPYNGTTTTCEALWMGVPVVSLRGDRHAGRVGASLLSTFQHRELIGETVADYVAGAVALSRDPARRATLHTTLRTRMQESPLMDAPAFARKVETAYRRMWQDRCAQR